MPDFVNPFSGKIPDRKLTMQELVRALRLDLAAEHEAVHIYLAHADATDNALAKAVLTDIADEERVHAGESEARDFDKLKPQVFNVGSNDLTEITLGASREDPNYDELRKGPLGYLQKIIGITGVAGVPACLCGDVANKFPDILVMIGMGFAHFSVPSKTGSPVALEKSASRIMSAEE